MAASKNKTRRSEKDAWEWIENVNCNAITQKHLEKAYRIHDSCSEKEIHRKNCKFIPNCFNQLGEKFWMKQLKDDVWHEIEDPKEQKREEGSFVGLKNLGATCYVNTLVQVWFHNDEFRSALYSWVPLDEPGSAVKDLSKDKMETDDIAVSYKGDCKEFKEHSVEQDREQSKSLSCDIEETSISKPKNSTPVCPPIPLCEPWADSKEPKMFCHHLQLLLAQLQYTTRRFVDPAPFVESLGLDKEQQQDAQEFSKLFMSLLEDTLSQQPNPVLRNIVQQQFGGSYIYITRCRNCGKQSQRNSTFYELDLNIHGNTNLSQCIKEFLKEEDLQGDNQYHCNYCMSKQNATRHIKLKELPPVLNLQLLRFVFDRKTGYKKKLNNQIWFPEVLDMKEYVDANMEGCVYDLTAVLIHRGLSAYSGHYIAHIKDKKSGIWYRFNDETTEKMKGSSLNLESEEDIHEVINGGNTTKRPKLSKGSSSKDAYMLVYRQRGEEKQAVAQEPPANIQLLVAKDNSKMDEWAKQVEEIRDKMAFVGRERQTEIQKVFEILQVAKADDDYEWIATEWLRKWLAVECERLTPVDNSSLVCEHGKLHPDKVLCAKRISTKAASFFYKRYCGSPRLKSNSFCLNCVKERCLSLQFESHITEDQKFFVKALKVTCERSGFWVSKKSLKKWKVLAQEIHGQLTPNRSSSPFGESLSSSQTPETAKRKTSSELSTSSEPSDNINQSQDNDSPGVLEKDTDCKRGLSGSDGGSAGIDDKEKLKFNEDLLCGHGCLSTSTVLRRLVTDKVWERLRFYFPEAPEFPWYHNACLACNLRDEEEAKRLGDLKQLAVHQKSILNNLYNEKERPEFDKKTSVTVYALSRTFYEEWRRFIRCPPQRRSGLSSISNKILICPHDKFLYHPRCEDNDGASSALVYLWCMEWEVLSHEFGYDVEIKIVGEVLEGNCYYFTTPDCCEECNSALVAEHFAESEEYESAEIYVRKITEEPTEEEAQAIVQSRSPVENGDKEAPRHQFVTGGTPTSSGDYLRRSSRHRKQRGEVIVTVDSSETVFDIKLELMKLFSAMPLDQHLSLNGKVLENDTTLGPAGVRPGSILILKIDQPKNEFPQEEFAAQASRQPEEGFKGTSLLKHPVTT